MAQTTLRELQPQAYHTTDTCKTEGNDTHRNPEPGLELYLVGDTNATHEPEPHRSRSHPANHRNV